MQNEAERQQLHIEAIERANRILTARLALSEANRRRLEELKESHATLQRAIITELHQAREHVQSANTELERRVDERTRELKATRDAALAASQAKSYFLATMSHELRTPLNAIIGYSELLAEIVVDGQSASDAFDPAQGMSLIDGDLAVADISHVVSAARHLLSIINDVLDLSKIEAGTTTLNYACFDLREFLETLADTGQTLARRHRNTFARAFEELPGGFISDRTKLRQIVLNLLSNAAKFTHEGSIDLRAHATDNSIEIAVRDSGIGIAQADFDRLFKPFAQVDAAANRRFEGTGLGLALSRSYAQMLGGDVHLESELGRGSTFTITLPLHPPTVPPLRGQTPKPRTAPSEIGPTPLLVIDEDERGRTNLLLALRSCGLQVEGCVDPETAKALIADAQPRVVILDVIRREQDGWDLLRELTAAGSTVLVLSGLDCPDRAQEFGAAGFVHKPATIEDLLQALRDALPSDR